MATCRPQLKAGDTGRDLRGAASRSLQSRSSASGMYSNRKPTILIVVGNYLPGFKAGGILRSVVNIVEHLHDRFDFLVITRDRDVGDDQPYAGIVTGQWVTVGNAKVHYLSPGSAGLAALAAVASQQHYDVLYLNSFFEPLCIRMLLNSRLGRVAARPVVVSPRGEFAWASLRLKYPKKLLFISAARLARLFKRVVWHAANAEEAADIGAVMNVRRREMVLAGDLPTLNQNLENGDPTEPLPAEDGLRIVFFSRISPEKNLDFVLRVLAATRIRASLDIIGPLENKDYWAACQRLIDHMPRNVTVRHRGTIRPSEAVFTLARYDLMFFPSGGESYGHVIAEALTVGTPVLTSTHTPWRDLEQKGLGWDLPLHDPAAFVRCLEQFAALDDASRADRRVAAREAARELLTGTDASDAHARLFYRALKTGRDMPIEPSGSLLGD